MTNHDPKDGQDSTLAELRALLEKATPGPWSTWETTDEDGNKNGGVKAPSFTLADLRAFNVGETNCYPEDAELIAALRNAAPDLLRVVEAVAKCEWDDRCDVCRGRKQGFEWSDLDHRDDCAWVLARKLTGGAL